MKYISFSLFGTEQKYYVGAEKNIVLNKNLLPDWTTVIYYHPENIISEYVEKLKDLGGKLVNVSNFHLCKKTTLEFPYFWRFISFFENAPTISRDLDSRISEREVQYIRNWENSEKNFFIIRDHPWHSPVPSGLFGMKNFKKDFQEHFVEFINNSELRWGSDQEILDLYIKKVGYQDVLYFGYDKPETYIKRENKNFFIGMQMDENDNPTKPSGEQCLNYLNELNL